MRDEFQVWSDAVCACVRFWPDRAGIARELRAHYEDRCRDLERLRYGPELAARRSLAAMGDARAVGEALDRVHRPGLGWLWEASRVLVWAVCILLAFNIAAQGQNYGPTDLTAYQTEQKRFLEEAIPLACPAAFQAGEYRMEATRAGYQWNPESGTGTLVVELTAATPKLWLPEYALMDVVEAADSGGVYRTGVYASSVERTHGRHRGWLTLTNLMDPPEWVEFTHKTAGWTVRIALPRGEGAAP